MFYRVKNNALYDYSDVAYSDECLETDITNQAYVDAHREDFDIVDGVLKKITNTVKYQTKITEREAKIQAGKNITKRQLLIWLYTQKGKTEDNIFQAINSISNEAQRYLAKVSYIGTNNFYYGNEFVVIIGQALGLTIDEIKTMFDEAKEL